MKLSNIDHRAAAAQLAEAERSRAQIPLLSKRFPTMDMDDAYAIQASWVEAKRSAGDAVIGWKIGLTSKAMQNALSIDTPDSGVLFESMRFANGATIPADRFIQPRIEAEIAFVMKHAIEGRNLTPEAILEATDHVAPAIEILDTRIVRRDAETGRLRTIYDTIADNAANAGIVLGEPVAVSDAMDLRWAGAIVTRDGEVEETGLGAGVLDDPARAVSWLVDRLTQYGGRIEAGQVVLSGSFIRPVECPPGSHVVADFGRLKTIELRFAQVEQIDDAPHEKEDARA
jgi:2-oxo-hept-3-ene-1,7-dioate hydratase